MFDPAAITDAVNRAGAELRALRNRVTVLQERLKNKVSGWRVGGWGIGGGRVGSCRWTFAGVSVWGAQHNA